MATGRLSTATENASSDCFSVRPMQRRSMAEVLGKQRDTERLKVRRVSEALRPPPRADKTRMSLHGICSMGPVQNPAAVRDAAHEQAAMQLDDAGLMQRMRRCFLVVCSHGNALQAQEIREYQWNYLLARCRLVGDGLRQRYFLDGVWSQCRTIRNTMTLSGFIDAIGKVAEGEGQGLRDDPPAATRALTPPEAAALHAAQRRRQVQQIQGVWDSHLEAFVSATGAPQTVTVQTLDPMKNGWSLRANCTVAMAVQQWLPGFRRLVWLYSNGDHGEVDAEDWRTLCTDLSITPTLLEESEADDAFSSCADRHGVVHLDGFINAMLICGLVAYSKLSNDGHMYLLPHGKIVAFIGYLARRIGCEFDCDVPGCEGLPVFDNARRPRPIPVRLHPSSGPIDSTVRLELAGFNFFCGVSPSSRLEALAESPTHRQIQRRRLTGWLNANTTFENDGAGAPQAPQTGRLHALFAPLEHHVHGDAPARTGAIRVPAVPAGFNKVHLEAPLLEDEEIAQMDVWTSVAHDEASDTLTVSFARLRVYVVELSHDSTQYSEGSDLFFTYEAPSPDTLVPAEVTARLREAYLRYAVTEAPSDSPRAGSRSPRGRRKRGSRRGNSKRGSCFVTQGNNGGAPRAGLSVGFNEDLASEASSCASADPVPLLTEEQWLAFCKDHGVSPTPKETRGLPLRSTMFNAVKFPRDLLSRFSATAVERDERGRSRVVTDGMVHEQEEGDCVTFTGFVLLLVWMFVGRAQKPPTPQQLLHIIEKPAMQKRAMARLETYNATNVEVSAAAVRESGTVCSQGHALAFAHLTTRSMAHCDEGFVKCCVCQAPLTFGDVAGVCRVAACNHWTACAACVARRSQVSLHTVQALACASGLTESWALHNGTADALAFPPSAQPSPKSTPAPSPKARFGKARRQTRQRSFGMVKPAPPKPPQWTKSRHGFGKQVLHGHQDAGNSVVVTNYPRAWATQREVDALFEAYQPARTSIGNAASDDVTVCVYAFWRRGDEDRSKACVAALNGTEFRQHVLTAAASPSLFVALGARRPMTSTTRRPSYMSPNPPRAPPQTARSNPTSLRLERLRQDLNRPVARRPSAASARTKPFSKCITGNLAHEPHNWLSLPIVIEAQWERNKTEQ
eukprot:TRINITY_DN30029_c0_g1_i1.p1 TRINITY_DN30029_c0_g1~~TRINITY_DN30029_c0_g1_i1.p1  ORF type:complete len:1131 (+),score=276.58 TRINITY_DN30029_c0_g1_i1:107-3499(+)